MSLDSRFSYMFWPYLTGFVWIWCDLQGFVGLVGVLRLCEICACPWIRVFHTCFGRIRPDRGGFGAIGACLSD